MRMTRLPSGIWVPARHRGPAIALAVVEMCPAEVRDRRRVTERLLRRMGGKEVYLSTGARLTTTVLAVSGTFSVTRMCIVTVRAIGGGGGATYQTVTLDGYGGGGGGGGAYTTGTQVTLMPGIVYHAVLGAAGANGVATGPVPTAGGASLFRINAGTIYVEVGGGQPGGAFTGTVFPGGAGGTAVTGSNLNTGGAGGDGVDGGAAPPWPDGSAGSGNGGGGGGAGDNGTNQSNGGGNAYVGGGASPGAGKGGPGGSGGSPVSANAGAGGGGAGGFIYIPSTVFAGYVDIALVNAL